jgi:hypothetical protein
LEGFTFQKPRKVICKVPEIGFIEPQFCPNWKVGRPKSTARTKMVHKKGGGKGWGTYYKYYYLGIQTIFYTYTTNLLSI